MAAKDTRRDVLRIAPPLMIDDEAIAYLLERFADAVAAVDSPPLTLPRPVVIFLAEPKQRLVPLTGCPRAIRSSLKGTLGGFQGGAAPAAPFLIWR